MHLQSQTAQGVTFEKASPGQNSISKVSEAIWNAYQNLLSQHFLANPPEFSLFFCYFSHGLFFLLMDICPEIRILFSRQPV